MKLSLKNKIVFITGVTSGIGKACAFEFAKEGANLILCARRAEKLQQLSDELIDKYRIKVLSVQLDVRSYEKVKNTINGLSDEWNKVDIIINNAGLARGLSKIYEGDITMWNEMIDTNIKGLLYITRELLPGMIKRNSGHVINIGSTAGHESYPMGNVYAATKFAVKALSQSIRIDVLGTNIRVSSVDPGMVETEFSLVRFSGDEQRAKKVYEGVTPLTPEDIADAAIYCATRHQNVNINEIIITPLCQASSNHINRK